MDRIVKAKDFYDSLSHHYHLLYQNWEMTIEQQSSALDRLIQSFHHDRTEPILDCACGIGTQAIGLAALGYTVTATDISSKAIARAAREARRRHLAKIQFKVADMRRLAAVSGFLFPIVICCDNPLAHLLDLEEVNQAARSIHSVMRPGGLLLFSGRDYEKARTERPTQASFRHRTIEGRMTIVFQIWEWESQRPIYTNDHFILQQTSSGWKIAESRTKMRAHTQAEIAAQFRKTGFTRIHWHSPATTGYFQPIMSAVRK
jgi:ubiquinone/menaquinone biosynthesis C-methylase UbiE